MTDPAVTRACFVHSRDGSHPRRCPVSCSRFPIEQHDASLHALGGTPLPGRDSWVAIALLQNEGRPLPRKPEAEEEQSKVVARAAIRCKEPSFQRWLLEDVWATARVLPGGEREALTVARLFDRLVIRSRKELVADDAKYARWQALIAQFEEHLRFGPADPEEEP